MGDYKIKTEDKAAFINLLKAKDVKVGSYEIRDDKAKPYFEFKTEDPRTEEIVKSILKTNKKINQIKEMGKLTKSQLAEIIREELANAKKEKEKLNEFDWNTLLPLIGPAVGVAGAALALRSQKNSVKQALQQKLDAGEINAMPSEEEIEKLAAKSLQQGMQQSYGGSSK